MSAKHTIDQTAESLLIERREHVVEQKNIVFQHMVQDYEQY